MFSRLNARLTSIFFALFFCTAFGQTNISDVNITSYEYQTIFGVFTNYTIKTFPYDQSYGADNFWTKWDIRYNADNSVSFHVGGYYVSATQSGGVGTATSIGTSEKFWLEEGNQGTFYIKNSEGLYLTCQGSGFKAVKLTSQKTNTERWYFFQPKNPGSDTITDANISNYSYQNIVGVFTNYILRSYPWEETYGADTYWAKWDVVDNGDNTFSFKIGNYYLLADSTNGNTAETTLTDAGKFTLSEVSGSYYLQNHEGLYLTCRNDNFSTMDLEADQTDAARWYFFEVEAPFVDSAVPTADAGDVIEAQVNESVTLDGSGSSDPTYTITDYFWTLIAQPSGSSLSYNNVSGSTLNFTPTVNGDYMFQLTVENSNGDVSWADSVTVDTSYRVEHAVYGSLVDDTTSTVSFSANFEATPAVFSAMLTHNGGDTSIARITDTGADSFDVFIEEETSKDSETNHGSAETIGYLAMIEGDITDINGNVIGEVGTLNRAQGGADTWYSFSSYSNTYTNPVVFMQTNTINGSDPCHMRVRNVTTSGFEYQVEEWEYDDGTHNSETVAYIIVEAGSYTLPNGSKLGAKTQNNVDENWDTVTYAQSYSGTPVILSMTQTENGNDPVVTRHKNANGSFFQVKLQEEEAKNNSHDNETIGIITIGN
ncbi:fascin domain-containing protein [Acanthopleuribacter pedis]|uniref:Uncharacterized protein n=1 Tax=Acanthopleuribacter pedis TaxID=442870 RepID=A0A8J7Q566_9BACT|nr:hypothetical protein [Acanthopleuribacter pedis]MBO1316834.1 hypothetical protein [Acanthopleuribacter pedis]